MTKALISIFETEGTDSLKIANEGFSTENIFEEVIQNSFFQKVNFTNCSFEECDLLNVNFDSCLFQNCTFNNTIIPRVEFTDCRFKNFQFIECHFNSKTQFFRTLFMNCQFPSVDFSFTFFCKCNLIL